MEEDKTTSPLEARTQRIPHGLSPFSEKVYQNSICNYLPVDMKWCFCFRPTTSESRNLSTHHMIAVQASPSGQCTLSEWVPKDFRSEALFSCTSCFTHCNRDRISTLLQGSGSSGLIRFNIDDVRDLLL